MQTLQPKCAGCCSQVWMESLVHCLSSLWFPLTPLSLSHSLTFYRAATDNSRRIMCCSVTGSTFCYEYVWKDGEKPLPALCLRLSKWRLTLWCACKVWNKAISRIRVCANTFCRKEEDAFYKGLARTNSELLPLLTKDVPIMFFVFMCFLLACVPEEKKDSAASLFSSNFFFKHLFHCPLNLLHLELCRQKHYCHILRYTVFANVLSKY